MKYNLKLIVFLFLLSLNVFSFCDYESDNFSAQFNKYKKENKGLCMAIMFYNGDGVQKDYKKAKEALKNSFTGTGEEKQFLKIINSEKKPKRIEYCKDIAYTTIAMSYCEGKQRDKIKAQLFSFAESVENKLPSTKKKSFALAISHLKSIIELDGEREYCKSISGTWRNIYKYSAEYRVIDNAKTALKILADNKLKIVSKSEFDIIDKELNKIYKERRAEYKLFNYGYKCYDDKSKSDIKQSKFLLRTIRDSQRLWIKYRDNLVLAFEKEVDSSTGLSILALLTKYRIKEL